MHLCGHSSQKGDGRSTIVIPEASKDDMATFTCSAQNGVRDDDGPIIIKTEEVKVTVQGTKTKTQDFLRILNFTNAWYNRIMKKANEQRNSFAPCLDCCCDSSTLFLSDEYGS